MKSIFRGAKKIEEGLFVSFSPSTPELTFSYILISFFSSVLVSFPFLMSAATLASTASLLATTSAGAELVASAAVSPFSSVKRILIFFKKSLDLIHSRAELHSYTPEKENKNIRMSWAFFQTQIHARFNAKGSLSAN